MKSYLEFTEDASIEDIEDCVNKFKFIVKTCVIGESDFFHKQEFLFEEGISEEIKDKFHDHEMMFRAMQEQIRDLKEAIEVERALRIEDVR